MPLTDFFFWITDFFDFTEAAPLYEAMASRRSHAAYHSRTASQRRVPRGHVSFRNPLQAPKERSCGISPHPLLVPQSGTDYHPQHHRGCVSPPPGRVFKIALKSCDFFTYSIDALDHQIWQIRTDKLISILNKDWRKEDTVTLRNGRMKTFLQIWWSSASIL